MTLKFIRRAVVTAVVLTAGCQSAATSSPAPARNGLHIDVLPGRSRYESADSPVDCTIRFTNDTDSAVLFPYGEILFEKHLILRLFRKSDPNPFAAEENLDERMVDFWIDSSRKSDATTIPPGGHYDYRVNDWTVPDWISYVNFGNRVEKKDTGGDWLVQARFDGKYFNDPPSAADAPAVWKTPCLSPIVTVHFNHGIETKRP